MKISNIDSISNLIDRLITEKIKAIQYKVENNNKQYDFQNRIIKEIKDKFQLSLENILENTEYQLLRENRTFKSGLFLEKIESLIVSDMLVGLAEYSKIDLVNEQSTDDKLFKLYIMLARFANENRSFLKNELDNELSNIIRDL